MCFWTDIIILFLSCFKRNLNWHFKGAHTHEVTGIWYYVICTGHRKEIMKRLGSLPCSSESPGWMSWPLSGLRMGPVGEVPFTFRPG